MMLDLQKASVLKRVSAFLLDIILLLILITGFAFVMSVVTGYDGYNERLEAVEQTYEEKYGVSFDISEEEYNKMTEDQRKYFDEAYAEFAKDEDALYLYNMQFNLILMISTVSILLAYVVLELILPLVFKNGQTVGKKIFGIALVHTNGVRLSTLALFVRTVLGKFTLETMIPVYIFIMALFGTLGLTGTIMLLLILVLQIGVILITKTNSCIHDLLANTVAVDLSSQMIFDSVDDMNEYKKKIHAEQVKNADY
ncbi:MAG: RDD family protein [Ruminococcaceae bacterium]|nr:RDD family protein [Oscillospiraceae bacterium]